MDILVSYLFGSCRRLVPGSSPRLTPNVVKNIPLGCNNVLEHSPFSSLRGLYVEHFLLQGIQPLLILVGRIENLDP